MLKDRNKRLLINQPEYKHLWAELPMKPEREFYPDIWQNDELKDQLREAAQFAPFIDKLYRTIEVETVTSPSQESKIKQLAIAAGTTAMTLAAMGLGVWSAELAAGVLSRPPYGW